MKARTIKVSALWVAAVLALGGCLSPQTPFKSDKTWKQDMSTYQADREWCARSAFWGWGWTTGQNYRFCMQRRGYAAPPTNPLFPVGDE